MPEQIWIAENELHRFLVCHPIARFDVRGSNDTARKDDVGSNLDIECPISRVVKNEDSGDWGRAKVNSLGTKRCQIRQSDAAMKGIPLTMLVLQKSCRGRAIHFQHKQTLATIARANMTRTEDSTL